MTIYVTKPVQVEAVQWNGGNTEQVATLCGAVKKDLLPGQIRVYSRKDQVYQMVYIGDYIVKTPNGDIETMSVKEFEAIYCLYPKRENDLMAKLRIACEALAALEHHTLPQHARVATAALEAIQGN